MLSVIITTYNRPVMLKQAIESVLLQTIQEKEIIVVDDNSTEDNSFCIPMVTKYIKNDTNKGLGENHKIGFNESVGEYVCFLDDDDYYTNANFFKDATEKFEKYPFLIMVCASTYNKYEPSNRVEPCLLNNPEYLSSFDYLLYFGKKYKKPQSTFTTIFRKESLLKAGFNQMSKPTDTCLYLRALTADGYVYCINNPVGNYRIHEVQMTKAQNPNFIIEVFSEKEDILNIIKNRIPSSSNWWYDQIVYTYDYYVVSKPKQCELLCVNSWISKRLHGSIRLFFHVWVSFLKKIYRS